MGIKNNFDDVLHRIRAKLYTNYLRLEHSVPESPPRHYQQVRA